MASAKCQIKEHIPHFVLVRTIATRQLIIAVSIAALKSGIKPGMTLAQARALYSSVEHAEHEPHRDVIGLEAMARWMMRFSPVVALQLAGGSGADIPVGVSGSVRQSKTLAGKSVPSSSPSGIWLDLTGTERLFGPAETILQTINTSLRRWGVTARLAIAPTPGAAWAMTFPALPSGEREIVSLRLPTDTIASLRHLGIRTIGQLRKLPREQLPARFGSILLTRLNQLDGIIDEPLVPIEPTAPICAHRRWEQPVESLEWIWPIAQELIDQIADKLLRRGHGAREIQATLRLALGEPITRIIRFSRPTREPKRMFELFRQAIERDDAKVTQQRGNRGRVRGSVAFPFVARPFRRSVAFPTPPNMVAFDYNGYIAVRFDVLRSQRIVTEQIKLGQTESFEGQVDLDDLIERLRVRIDQAGVAQARSVESHVPERGFAFVETSLIEEARRQRDKETKRQSDIFSSPLLSVPASFRLFSIRPLSLHTPRELRVIVSPSDDRDGRPVSVTDPWGNVHRVAHAVGPERICGEWWIGHDKSRDYFDIELPDHRRWWIFRVNESGRWFWQGNF